MKISIKIFTGILLALTLASGHSCTTYRPVSRQSGTASLQLFYDALSPYGEWVQNREYGFVWIPHAGRNFFPYATNGRWIYTDYGWTWLSDYEWGWAPFHYGRWDYDPAYGWFWFPGEEWGPAWVTWRAGDGYYGWSPMRPETDFGFGYPDADIYSWIFVPERDFGRRDLSRYFVSTRRNDEILPRTEVLGSRRADNSVYASGPDPVEVRRATGRNIDRVTVSELGTPGRRLNGNRLEIYRPRVVTATTGHRPAPSRITDVKDIRPMRERDRNYRPEGQGNIRELGQPGTGQGTRESGSVENSDSREREARRQRDQKQYDMQRQRQEAEEQQRQRQLENSGQKQEPNREYRQTRSERRQVTDQQKSVMEKERQSNDRAIQDSSSSRRTERMQSKNIRRRR
jgi:hypothetical protein